MLRRLALLSLLILPLAAHADDASMLGPQTSANTNLQQTNSSGDGPAGLSALQPAEAGVSSSTSASSSGSTSGTSLQSMGSDGLASSTSAAQSLQQPASSQTANLLVQGEADQPHTLSNSSSVSWLGYILIILLVVTALTALAWFIDRRRG